LETSSPRHPTGILPWTQLENFRPQNLSFGPSVSSVSAEGIATVLRGDRAPQDFLGTRLPMVSYFTVFRDRYKFKVN